MSSGSHPVRNRSGRTRLPRVVWLLVIGRGVNRLGAFTLPFLTVALTDLLGASVSAAGMPAADLELVGHRVLDGRILLSEYHPTGKDIPRI